MVWRNLLLPGSFRGVPFGIDGHSARIAGRRAQTHEYPGRDEPYTEDLGKRTKSFTLEAWVVGDLYIINREALILACNLSGPGWLVHPYLGIRLVVCTSCDVTERTDEGRMARFNLEFVEAGTNRYPTDRANTSAVSSERAIASVAAVVLQFTSAFRL